MAYFNFINGAEGVYSDQYGRNYYEEPQRDNHLYVDHQDIEPSYVVLSENWNPETCYAYPAQVLPVVCPIYPGPSYHPTVSVQSPNSYTPYIYTDEVLQQVPQLEERISSLNPETPEWTPQNYEGHAASSSELREKALPQKIIHNSTLWPTAEPFDPRYLSTNTEGRADADEVSSIADDVFEDDPRMVANDLCESGRASAPRCRPPAYSPPGSPCTPSKVSRRRRKPRSSRVVETTNPVDENAKIAPLARFKNINMDEESLSAALSKYAVCPSRLGSLGFPVESENNPTSAVIYALDFMALKTKRVNYKEYQAPEDDSGQGSGSSSPRSPDSENEEDPSKMIKERLCARCRRTFNMFGSGEYETSERCRYHHGRLTRSVFGDYAIAASTWSCCDGAPKSVGCTKAAQHVWTGTNVGLNGPIRGYVRTRPRTAWRPCRAAVALDCEMVYTASGLEIAQLEIVGLDGLKVYSAYVKPASKIIDYNTRYSGLTEENLRSGTKTLKEVQNDLLEIIDEETLIIGHGLENDLRALRMLHSTFIDTSVCFPHERGYPYRQSLKSLAQQHLNISVQHANHCPFEDARVSLDLVLLRFQRDAIAGA